MLWPSTNEDYSKHKLVNNYPILFLRILMSSFGSAIIFLIYLQVQHRVVISGRKQTLFVSDRGIYPLYVVISFTIYFFVLLSAFVFWKHWTVSFAYVTKAGFKQSFDFFRRFGNFNMKFFVCGLKYCLFSINVDHDVVDSSVSKQPRLEAPLLCHKRKNLLWHKCARRPPIPSLLVVLLRFAAFRVVTTIQPLKHLPKPLLSLEVVVVDKRRKKPTTKLSDFKAA